MVNVSAKKSQTIFKWDDKKDNIKCIFNILRLQWSSKLVTLKSNFNLKPSEAATGGVL